MALINPPESKLAKRTSVHYSKVANKEVYSFIRHLRVQGRNPYIIWLFFWEKRWLHKLILKFTDLYIGQLVYFLLERTKNFCIRTFRANIKEDLIKSYTQTKMFFQFKANFCVKNNFILFEIDFIEVAVNDGFFRFNFLISSMIDIESSTNLAKLSQIQGPCINNYLHWIWKRYLKLQS